MLSTISLISKLRGDFPRLRFVADTDFRWSPTEKTVYYSESQNDTALLLHELAHAVLEHADYARDVQLIEMEQDAWSYASETLGPRYGTQIDSTLVEDSLDTYRDWLHARSTCPSCQATGVQTKDQHYKCIACGSKWRVNDARVCALRRYKITK